MSSTTIYAFLSDEIYWEKKFVDLDKSVNKGLGYIDDILINYFDKIATISDPRSSRINTLEVGVPVNTNMKIVFDSSKLEPTNLLFQTIDNISLGKIFNIVEQISLMQKTTTSDLNDYLMANPGHFDIYVNNSVKRSSTLTTLQISYPVQSTPTTTTIKNVTVTIYDVIEFTVRINSIDTTFKLWINSEKFKLQYPLNTIKGVVFPIEPKYLIDPTPLINITKALSESSKFTFTESNAPLHNDDFSGIYPFKTTWVISSLQKTNITFGIYYKGSKPTTLQCRKYVQTVLLNLGIAPSTTWEARLPDIFVVNQFYIIPLWGHQTLRPERILYPSVININNIFGIINNFYPPFSTTFIKDNIELFLNAHDEIFLIALPDYQNDDVFSLYKQHPTYQYHSAMDSTHAYMEASTKEFNLRLNKAMSVLFGETVTNEFNNNRFYGRDFLSFTVNRIEYHIMTKSSYFDEDVIINEDGSE